MTELAPSYLRSSRESEYEVTETGQAIVAPADRLIAAADLLDERAGEATEGPWHAFDEAVWPKPTTDPNSAESIAEVLAPGSTDRTADAAYIATMDPDVGKALAKLLRREGHYVRQGEGRAFGGGDMALADGDTLAIADLLLASMTSSST